MNFNKKLLDNIENIVKLSDDFDSEFKIIIDLPNNQIDEKNAEIIYSLTKNYILIRKQHGELLLMQNILLNQSEQFKSKKDNKDNIDNIDNIDKLLYDISTFSSLIININELLNNIDLEYKKIALKYPKFINKKSINIILVTKNNEYNSLIEELKKKYPENKYKIIKYENDKDKDTKNKNDKELNEFNIKIKMNNLPLIYIINNSNIIEIPISKINNIESIKNLLE
jgi:hypothetical protein